MDRELWLKLNPNLEPKVKDALLKEAERICVGLIVDHPSSLLGKFKLKIASPKPPADILLSSNLDEAADAVDKGWRIAYILDVSAGKDFEAEASEASELKPEFMLIRCRDWRVIPLENLVASLKGKVKLLAEASSLEDISTLTGVLELGVDGVVFEAADVDTLRAASSLILGSVRLKLDSAEVKSVRPIGLGARVCVDTCDIMGEGEGLLVGCQSSFLFLVEAEVWENPYVSPRPFRVNAGPVGSYVYAPGDRTLYLSEVSAGSEVLVVDREGRCRTVNVCRAKIEWRPLILVEAVCGDYTGKVILQNAETIRLVTPESSKSVADLKPGDKVVVYVKPGGRHFGKLVESERVIEK